jgi:hypothetical protein
MNYEIKGIHEVPGIGLVIRNFCDPSGLGGKFEKTVSFRHNPCHSANIVLSDRSREMFHIGLRWGRVK